MSEQPDEDQSTTQSTESTEQTTEQSTERTTEQSTRPAERSPARSATPSCPRTCSPSEDNPLATHPDQTGDEDDQIGADREEDPETAPADPRRGRLRLRRP